MLDFCGLREKPFSLLPNPRFMYLSEPYLETKAKLLYFLKDRTASLYVYGPVGSGKTLAVAPDRPGDGRRRGDQRPVAEYPEPENHQADTKPPL